MKFSTPKIVIPSLSFRLEVIIGIVLLYIIILCLVFRSCLQVSFEGYEGKGHGDDGMSDVDVGFPLEHGTRILLHLKEDASEFVEESRIREVIKKHSQFVKELHFPLVIYDVAPYLKHRMHWKPIRVKRFLYYYKKH